MTKGTTTGRSRRRLGRGLESLISAPVEIEVPDAPPSAPPTKAPEPAGPAAEGIQQVPVDRITPSPRQPRRDFDEAGLEQLANSIRSAGLMQPVVVRAGADGGYELVAGERRWRAAQRIGLKELPAIVRDLDDRTAAELSIIENVQREDLNPIERADAFHRLAQDFGLTHAEIASRVGLDRTSVTNHLRLRELDPIGREALRSGRLSMGHGRALLALTNIATQRNLTKQAVAGGWSVRELERRVRAAMAPPAPKGSGGTPSAHAAHMDDLQRRLGKHLGTKVAIRTGRKRGTGEVSIAFYSFDEFDGLMNRLGFEDAGT